MKRLQLAILILTAAVISMSPRLQKLVKSSRGAAFITGPTRKELNSSWVR